MTAHSLWLIVIVLAVVAVVLGSVRLGGRSRFDGPWPLEPKSPLLSVPEQVLYRRLIQALPQNIVFAQVQLLQVLRFKRGRYDAGIQNRFSQLSLDFLILKPDMAILAAIELDDSSHARAHRRDADFRKKRALDSAGIPLIRWTTARLPEVDAIRAAVAGAHAEQS